MRIVGLCALALVLVTAPRAAHAGDGTKLLPLLDDKVHTVMVVNLKQARGSAAFDLVMKMAEGSDTLAKLSAAGFDFTKMDTVLIAATGGGDSLRFMVLEGPVTDDEVSTWAHAGGAQPEKKEYGGSTYWALDNVEGGMVGKRFVIAAPGEMTKLIDRSKKKSSHALTRSAKAAAVRAAIAMTDTRASAWMVSSSPQQMSGKLPSGIAAISLAMSLGKGVTAQMKAQAADAETATELGDKLQGGLDKARKALDGAGLKGLAASLSVDVDDDIVTVGANLPGDELETFVQLARAFI